MATIDMSQRRRTGAADRPALTLDHLAIAAARLGEGIDFVEETLGVRMPLGGKHAVMNTHNAVLRLGDGLYLEVIAVDPEAGPPQRPRWFGLDNAKLQSRLTSLGPCLVAWIVRTDNLAATLEASRGDLGAPVPMTRGALSWQIGVTPSGQPAMGGLKPVAIQWSAGEHPTQRMPDLGVRFGGLTLRAPKPEALRIALAGIGADRLADIKPYRRSASPLEATFIRPDGLEASISGGDWAGLTAA
jgi:Glyoxalase-like domain